MSLEILKEVIIEEFERKQRALKSFNNVLNDISYCSNIYIKNIKGNDYLYVKYRKDCNQKPKETLIGNAEKVEESKLEEIKNQSKMWYQYQKQAKEVKQDISKLERIMKLI